MKPYKGRSVQQYMKVDVYRNLNQGRYSIRCAKTGLVLAHADTVHISNCTFHINQKAIIKVLESRRSVHAWIRGIFLQADCEHPTTCEDIIYYNPYQTSNFINPSTNLIPVKAKEIYVAGKLAYGSIKVDDWLNNEEGLFAFAN